MHVLELGKRVEADEGYHGHAGKIKCPGNDVNLAENWTMKGRVRARHEMLNWHLKNWGILYQAFCHHITMYRNVFWVCVMLTQLTVKNSEPLFVVEYKD